MVTFSVCVAKSEFASKVECWATPAGGTISGQFYNSPPSLSVSQKGTKTACVEEEFGLMLQPSLETHAL